MLVRWIRQNETSPDVWNQSSQSDTSVQSGWVFCIKKSNLFIIDQQIQPNKRSFVLFVTKTLKKRASESVDPSEQSSPQPPSHHSRPCDLFLNLWRLVRGGQLYKIDNVRHAHHYTHTRNSVRGVVLGRFHSFTSKFFRCVGGPPIQICLLTFERAYARSRHVSVCVRVKKMMQSGSNSVSR